VLPFCHVTLRGHKSHPPGYPRSLKTIGDHLRKRRFDLKLAQREVAERTGVNKTTVQFWENNQVKPSLAFIPKITEFLGYDPYGSTACSLNSLGDTILAFRRRYGLSQKKLARLVGIDPTTIGAWERGEHQPTKRLLNKLLSFFTSYSSSA